ncbi:hypothetical protein OB934_07655 [Aeromonas salmonicida]|uniref:zonular occludens toxin domain-containing protein n=1 Tax=Aeromonas salmonicida TaxID=645 RepID=UPI00259F1823|nr:zonular occludens toxin domain-containing protein [Aeromonas salmonicida]MDM5062663.1 hypothetical protein [Aeromonas salmonicida]MDM5062671.1 hypothetical protein [Aeromonas salmonicida]
MAVYFVTGKLGSGKTLFTIDIIQQALGQGRRVASNLDLNLEHMLGPKSKQSAIRLPDKPRLVDLEAIGTGYPTDEPYDESKFGVVVLDELAMWMNTRTFQDKERLFVLQWFLHARKLRWDIYFIVQHIEAIDKQLRESMCEHLVVCSRADRIKFMKMFKFPQVHLARIYYGDNESAPLVDRVFYRSKELYGAYDTQQVFTDDLEWLGNRAVDMRSLYSVLPPMLTTGRYQDDGSGGDTVSPWRFLLSLLFWLPVNLAIKLDAESRRYFNADN